MIVPFSWAAGIFLLRFETLATGSDCPLDTYGACYYRLRGLAYNAARRSSQPLTTTNTYLELNTLTALA